LTQTANAPWAEDKREQGLQSVMANPGQCDMRHNGAAKTDIKPDNEDFSDFIAVNNHFLLVFSLGLMLRLAT
jgi:hypothetical protein